MNNITKRHLQAKVDTLNKMLDRPATAFTRSADGNLRGNVGHFSLDYAYGGVRLVEMTNEQGGEHDVLHYRGTKREMAAMIDAVIAGVRYGRGEA